MTKTNAYEIVDIGPPPSFKNGKLIVHVGGKARLVTRSDRKKWMQQATQQLERQRRERGYKRVEKGESLPIRKWKPGAIVRVSVCWDGKGRLADPDGMLTTIMDCLVKAGLLADDGPRYVNETRVGWLGVVKDSKVTITIETRQEEQSDEKNSTG